ncbi:sterile alpha motif domain-containing protein 12-like [Symsagittifera roscoffensis]|uniref:sterile alpha motif domain-containing protein 12-like n=1 Tax=Symsagittifera roscoffensis TaxID=84072 RepID=UPI00307B29F1
MVTESSVVSSAVEPSSTASSSAQLARMRAAALWSSEEVVKWLKRYESRLADKYAEVFLAHDVNGAALTRLNDKTLKELGVDLESERSQLMHQIYRLKIKQEIFDLQRVMSTVQEKENMSPKINK